MWLYNSDLHGAVVLLPPVVVDLRLNQRVRVRHLKDSLEKNLIFLLHTTELLALVKIISMCETFLIRWQHIKPSFIQPYLT